MLLLPYYYDVARWMRFWTQLKTLSGALPLLRAVTPFGTSAVLWAARHKANTTRCMVSKFAYRFRVLPCDAMKAAERARALEPRIQRVAIVGAGVVARLPRVLYGV